MNRTPFKPGDQQGGAALYALVLFPVVLGFMTLALDVTSWMNAGEELQAAADRTALAAALALPDTARANAILDTSIKSLPAGIQALRAEVTSSTVDLVLGSSQAPVFGSFFGSKHRLKASREAKAGLRPRDVVMIVPNGPTMRPGIVPGSVPPAPVKPWKDLGEWPASDVFSCFRPPLESDLLAWWPAQRYWSDADYRLWATQACFNPVFSEVKQLAVHLVDLVSGPARNRTGVIFNPGDSDFVRVMRRVRARPPVPGGFSITGTQLAGAWMSSYERETGISGEFCVLTARSVSSASSVYELPMPAPSCEPISDLACGSAYPFHPELSSCLSTLGPTVREAIYWQPSRLMINGSPAEDRLPEALTTAWEDLVGSTEAEINAETVVRGNLSIAPIKQIVVFADKLPNVSDAALGQILPRLAASGIELLIIAFEHRGLKSAELSELRAQGSAWNSWINDSGTELVTLKYFSSVEDLVSSSSTFLPSWGRQAVLLQ